MNKQMKLLSFTVMFAAINYIVFTYLKINIPMPTGGSVAIHVANAVVVLSAWLIGPRYGTLAGATGLSLADVLDPLYVALAPKTFFLKFMIAYIAGLGFNVVFEPIIGYVYKRYILGASLEAASILTIWLGGVIAFNAVICVFVSVVLYRALYKRYKQIA